MRGRTGRRKQLLHYVSCALVPRPDAEGGGAKMALGVPVRLAREPQCSCEEVAPSWVHANDDAVVIHAQASGLCMAAQSSGRGEMPGNRASHQPGSTSSHTCRQLYLEACSSAQATVGGIAAPGMSA